MTELAIEELEMNLAKNDSYREEEISADDTGSNLVEEVKDTSQHQKQMRRLTILRKKRLQLLKK